jgi:hypothetical protein
VPALITVIGLLLRSSPDSAGQATADPANWARANANTKRAAQSRIDGAET